MCNAGSDNADDDQTFFKPDMDDDEKRKSAKESMLRQRHKTVMRVTRDLERNNFNTAISAMMELTNATVSFLQCASPERRSNCENAQNICRDIAETMVKLIAPICPHMAEELWVDVLKAEGSVHTQA